MQNAKISKNWPSGHHRTTLLGCIFATTARIDNQKKKLLNSNMSPACPHKMVNFSLLAAEIVSLVWSTPANFNGLHILAALLHGTVVVGVSQTLWRWTEGATYILQAAITLDIGPILVLYNIQTILTAVSCLQMFLKYIAVRTYEWLCLTVLYCFTSKI